MRRLTKKITSIVLLASFTASLSSMALAADVGTVTDDCVRLRRKASTSSDSLGMLVKGDKVSILDQDDAGQKSLQEGGAGQLAELGQKSQGHKDKGDAEAQGDEVEGPDAVEAHFHQQVRGTPS